MTVLHQAVDSITHAVYTWSADSYDGGAGYPGPNTPTNILVIAGLGPGRDMGSAVLPDAVPAALTWVQKRDGSAPIGVRDRVNVMLYGVKGDGVTDDTVAIQSCLDANKPADARNPGNPEIFFPHGIYKISAPLSLYGGQKLRGVGNGSRINTTSTFPTGRYIFEASDAGQTNRNCYGIAIRHMSFSSGVSDVGIYLSDGVSTLNSTFEDLWQFCERGINTGTGYFQASLIKNIHVFGDTKQVLVLRGNFNEVDFIDVEGGGLGTDPYILVREFLGADDVIYGSQANILRRILIEGGTTAGKPTISFDGTADCDIFTNWDERSGRTSGIHINNSSNLQFRGPIVGLDPVCPIVITNNSSVRFAELQFTGASFGLGDVIIADTSSRVDIDYMTAQTNGWFPALDSNYHVKSWKNLSVGTGESPWGRNSMPTKNLLLNPSFEAGYFAWGTTGVASTLTTVTSTPFGGSALRVTANANGEVVLYQTVAVTTDMVAVPLTFTACVNRHTGGSSSQTQLAVEGCGIASTLHINTFNATNTWQSGSVTIVPQTTGTIYLKITTIDMVNGEYLDVDNTSLVVSDGSFGSSALQGTWLDVGDISIFTGNSAPTFTGFKRGSICWNTAAASGTPTGWQFDGTNWKPMANLP